MKKPTYIDLFAGCGGLSLGLYHSGWQGLFAVEKGVDSFKTLQHNLIINKNHFFWPKWLPISNYDINKLIEGYGFGLECIRGDVDLVAGGPPCQGFSSAGRRDENDERNRLIYSYIKFIKLIKPKYVFFENVMGFTYAFQKKGVHGVPYSSIVKSGLMDLGYSVSAKIINFSDYGVPQRRKRFILIGSLDENAETFFDKLSFQKKQFLKSKNLDEVLSVEDAISDLQMSNGVAESPDSKGFYNGIYSKVNSSYQAIMRKNYGLEGELPDSHRFANHTKKVKERFDCLINEYPHNKEIKELLSQRFGLKKRSLVVLDKKGLCPTLTSLPDDCVHYCEPRILTVREYARIQSFPDCYSFKGKYTTGGDLRKVDVPRYTQIGNAIPPLFVEQVGNVLMEMLNNAKKIKIPY